MGDRKKTHINDLIDSAIFIKENELAPKLAICATNPSGSLTALSSVFREPYLFEGVSVLNPICDLSNHLLHDILDRGTDKSMGTDEIYFQKLTEFGDIASDRGAFERVMSFSPYHMPMLMTENRPITDILLCCDTDSPYKYHSRKMIAKIRETSAFDPLYAFYREFPDKMYSEEQKYAEMYSFLVNSLLYNT